MSRRGRKSSSRGRGMLGSDGEHAAAKNKVQLIFNSVVAASYAPPFNLSQVLDWLITDEHKPILRAAKGVVYQDATRASSEFSIHGIDGHINIDFTSTPYAVPNAEALRIWKPEGQALRDHVNKIVDVYRAWHEVLYLVNYFDKYATPGAARYYWPTILALAPTCEALQNASGAGAIQQPEGVTRLLPMMRRTSTLVAGALMLGTQKLEGTAVKLHIGTRYEFTNDEGVEIPTTQWNVGLL